MEAYDRAVLACQRGEFVEARKLLAQASSEGRAWLLLGQLASEGRGEPADPQKAARFYVEGAKRGSAEAAYNLGALYATGRGVGQDYEAALSWYRRAAELGDVDAGRMIGVMYAEGQGISVDFGEAERWWREASARGQVFAMQDLGWLFLDQRGDLIEAVSWFLQAAQAGSKDALQQLRDLEADLREVAETGDGRARTLLGVIHFAYLDDPAGAVRLLRPSAEDGDPIAQRTLAYLLQEGLGVERDLGRAIQFYHASAEGGDTFAAYNLGLLYSKGDGVPLDRVESVRWLRRAAESGLSAAYSLLGDQLVALGRDDEALHWYLQGADKGEANSMFRTATLYRDGVGTRTDLVQSLRWFLAMMNVDNADGLHEAHQIVPRMNNDEIRQAASLAGRPADAEVFLRSRAES